MTPERKRLAHDLIESITSRIDIVDQMIQGTRPGDIRDAKIYMNEIKKGIGRVNEIIDIS